MNKFQTSKDDKDQEAFLSHILVAIADIQRFYTPENLEEEVYRLAIERCFEIIGEAVKHLNDETKALRGDIPWNKVSDTRNYIIHGYFGVSHPLLEQAIIDDIPILKTAVEEILTLTQKE